MAESDEDMARRLQREEMAQNQQAGGARPTHQQHNGSGSVTPDDIPTAVVVGLPQGGPPPRQTIYGGNGAHVGPGANISAESMQHIYIILATRRQLMIFAVIDIIFGLLWSFGISALMLITLLFPVCALYSCYHVISWGVWGYIFYQGLQIALQVYFMTAAGVETYQVIFSILNILVSVYIGYLCWQYLTAVRAFTADLEAVRSQINNQAQEGFWQSVTYVPVRQPEQVQGEVGGAPGMAGGQQYGPGQGRGSGQGAGAPRASY